MWWKCLWPVPWLREPSILSLSPSLPLSKLPLPQAQLVCWRRRHRCRGSCVGSVTPNLDQQNWPADPQTCAQKQMFIIERHCNGWLSCSNILAINNGYRQWSWNYIRALENLWAVQASQRSLQSHISSCSQDASTSLTYDMGTYSSFELGSTSQDIESSSECLCLGTSPKLASILCFGELRVWLRLLLKGSSNWRKICIRLRQTALQVLEYCEKEKQLEGKNWRTSETTKES